MFVDIVKVLIL